MVHRRRRIRRFGRRLTGRQAAAALVCGVLLAVAVHHAGGTPAGQARAGAVATPAAAAAIAFARAQLGRPYEWGGTGPGAYDCSGLVMMAYRAAGIDIERTSQAQ